MENKNSINEYYLYFFEPTVNEAEICQKKKKTSLWVINDRDHNDHNLAGCSASTSF